MRFLLGLAFVVATSLSAADRVAVRVVDPSGERPLAEGGVACADPAGPGATVGEDGRIPVVATCKRVRCWAEGYLPGEADLSGIAVDCRVTGAARIDAPVAGLASADGMEGRLYAVGTGELAAREPLSPANAKSPAPRVVLGPVPVGRYRLDLVHKEKGWTCRADLGPLAQGAHAGPAEWRDPVLVTGKVVDGDERPVEKIAVRIWDEFPETAPPSNRAPAKVDPIGRWTCGPSAPMKGGTKADGTFTFPADPEGSILVAAGGWDDPLGLAARTFVALPGEVFLLRPERPVRLAATVVDDEDRPLACRAALTVRSAESAWLAKLLPGATLEAPCSGDGTLRLGPFLTSEWELYVRPKPGLPLRLRGAAPAPGSTEDLGVIRVPRGVAVTVDVFGGGGTVEGARVLGSGSAGLVFNVEAFTDQSGRAELSGFPEGARLRLEVSAEGYRTLTRDGLELRNAPIRVELDRAAIIEGEVVGQSGEPVPGADVFALMESGDLAARTTSGSEGTFRISDAAPGTIRLIANAQGYRRGEPVPLMVEAGDTRSGVVLPLARAKGVRGKVVDRSGAPVSGATVALVPDYGTGVVDADSSVAVAVTGAEGTFVLAADPQPRQSVVATAPGHGPAVDATPLAKADSEIVLTLAPPGSVEVRLPSDLPPTRQVTITDGRKVRRSQFAAGRTAVLFTDLAVGKGEAALPPGTRKPMDIVEGTTVVVELRDGVTVEGTVTQNGRPLPNFVIAVVSLRDGGIAMAGAVETDARGNWRRENLAPGPYLFSAVGPEGRAEKRVELPTEGTVRVDLAVTSVIVDAVVTDASSGEPVPAASLFLKPDAAECRASMSTRSFGNLFDTDIDLSVSDGGCGFGSTSADGRVRIVLSSSGRMALQAGAKRYEALDRQVDLREGVNTLSLQLEPKAGPRVRVTMRTDPPGLPGTLECVMAGGQSRHSYGGVSGTQECPFGPGPAEVIFRVDGYGIGRKDFVVPEDGDLDVTVTAVRCGQLLVGRSVDSDTRPIVRDATGVDWGTVLTRTSGAFQTVETAELGPAWLFRYLPPGVYAVEVDGSARGSVTIEAGSTATFR